MIGSLSMAQRVLDLHIGGIDGVDYSGIQFLSEGSSRDVYRAGRVVYKIDSGNYGNDNEVEHKISQRNAGRILDHHGRWRCASTSLFECVDEDETRMVLAMPYYRSKIGEEIDHNLPKVVSGLNDSDWMEVNIREREYLEPVEDFFDFGDLHGGNYVVTPSGKIIIDMGCARD